jgi:hypothetical protein
VGGAQHRRRLEATGRGTEYEEVREDELIDEYADDEDEEEDVELIDEHGPRRGANFRRAPARSHVVEKKKKVKAPERPQQMAQAAAAPSNDIDTVAAAAAATTAAPAVPPVPPGAELKRGRFPARPKGGYLKPTSPPAWSGVGERPFALWSSKEQAEAAGELSVQYGAALREADDMVREDKGVGVFWRVFSCTLIGASLERAPLLKCFMDAAQSTPFFLCVKINKSCLQTHTL